MPTFAELTNTSGTIWNIDESTALARTAGLDLPGVRSDGEYTNETRREAYQRVTEFVRDCFYQDNYYDFDISIPSYSSNLRKTGETQRLYWWSHDYKRPLQARLKSILENAGLNFTAERNTRLGEIISRTLPKQSDNGVWRGMLTTLTPDETASEHVNNGSCLWGMYEHYRPRMMDRGVMSLRLINKQNVLTHRAWVLEGTLGYLLFDFYYVNGKITSENYRMGITLFSGVLDQLPHANGAFFVNAVSNGLTYCDTDNVIFVPKMGAKMGTFVAPTFAQLIGMEDNDD